MATHKTAQSAVHARCHLHTVYGCQGWRKMSTAGGPAVRENAVGGRFAWSKIPFLAS